MKSIISPDEIARVKQANPLNEYLAKRGVELHGTGNRLTALCPFHDEKTPSYTVYLDTADQHAHCFACSFHGDVIEHEQKFTGASFPEACFALGGKDDHPPQHISNVVRKVMASILDPSLEHKVLQPASRVRITNADNSRPDPPRDIHEGSPDELRKLSRLRRLSIASLSLASSAGVLRFATVCGFPSWIVTDASGRAMEARRMDGKEYPAVGKLGERKSHALKNSRKSWPVGIQPQGLDLAHFDTILLVEGQPDLLAGYHFIEAAMANDPHPGRSYKMLPVAILGRSNTIIPPDAQAVFRGKRVRTYSHADSDHKGREAGERWMKQLHSAGAGPIDAFDFRGLFRRDGKPINDLNDCAVIRDADKPELKGLLP